MIIIFFFFFIVFHLNFFPDNNFSISIFSDNLNLKLKSDKSNHNYLCEMGWALELARLNTRPESSTKSDESNQIFIFWAVRNFSPQQNFNYTTFFWDFFYIHNYNFDKSFLFTSFFFIFFFCGLIKISLLFILENTL